MAEMAEKCAACLENHTEFVKLQCRCTYCHPCIREFLSTILGDPSLYPWRYCATVVDRDAVAPALTDSLAQDWATRHAQYLAKQNLAPKCAWEGCGVLLDRGGMTIGSAICGVCGRETCLACRRESRAGHVCIEQAAEGMQAIDMVEAERWQRCFQCRAMVQRDQGCNHITCLCKAEFCYTCGIPWKHCPCFLVDVPELPGLLGGPMVPGYFGPAIPGLLGPMALGYIELHGIPPPLLPPQPQACYHALQGRVAGPMHCQRCGFLGVYHLNECLTCGARLCNHCTPLWAQFMW